ncbi:MAG: phosphoribosyltransferase family protein [Pseudomonadota bacterium]
MRTPHRWDRGRAAFQYDGTGRRLILSLKHGDRLDLAPLLAGWMARAAEPLLADADLIIPIPLHWTRRIKRRYNQSAELARQLCAVSGGRDRFAPDFLYRSRRTATQDGRDRDARIANVAAAIKPNPARKTRLVGRKVLLVDDVMTTGATLDAAADACLDAGASSVDVVVSALVNFDPAPYVASTAKPKDTRNEAD